MKKAQVYSLFLTFCMLMFLFLLLDVIATRTSDGVRVIELIPMLSP
jgi:hypothetical protein